jgi:hypothetical protein
MNLISYNKMNYKNDFITSNLIKKLERKNPR